MSGGYDVVNGVLFCNTTQNGFALAESYIPGPGGEQLTEMTNNSGTWQWAHTNVYAGGQQVATHDAGPSGQTTGKLYFHLSDWLGTRRQQTDYAGNPVLNFTGLPFGDGLGTIPVSSTNAADATEYHFTGKERDTESGNDYFGAMNGAAGVAEKSALGISVDSQHHGKWQEFGGWILKAVDGGGYSYTNPVATSGAHGHFNSLAVSVPDGYTEVGYYHTHPHITKENVEGEGFSGVEGDVGFIARNPGLGTAYVADTISRNMYRITPRPGGNITPGVDSRGRTTCGMFVRHIPGDPY